MIPSQPVPASPTKESIRPLSLLALPIGELRINGINQCLFLCLILRKPDVEHFQLKKMENYGITFCMTKTSPVVLKNNEFSHLT